ncbi:hypothetical protein NBRC3257_0544 [Gluconobacter thailandicus NBRC 3257]|uniref:Uncharacterized protein n=1 Tax=Gluconobacter thailandicus NBRC 3257 TaxID=1381097 RepID=A0ABQ0ITN5_GLUTH|nr:hypothetical protein NBRC3257_0544 [Gluconobacter thailandicus NBRC 3257]
MKFPANDESAALATLLVVDVDEDVLEVCEAAFDLAAETA